MAVIKGGQAIYGADIGIVMLDCRFPRPLGDPGNARSFSYPVQYEIVELAETEALTRQGTEEALHRLFEAAGRLEKRGCKSIATSCGLLVPYQEQLREKLAIPVVSSAILLLPLLLNMTGDGKKAAVVVSSRTEAIDDYLNGLPENQRKRCVLLSMEKCPEFMRGIMSYSQPYELDTGLVEKELINLCLEAKGREPEISLFLLECTNLAPYSRPLRERLGMPVYDIRGLIDFLHSSVEL